MLYCPKCQKPYEDGAQRFCTNDGARLVSPPNAASSSSSNSGDVFADLIGAAPVAKAEDRLASLPHFASLNQPNAFFEKRGDAEEEDDLLELETSDERKSAAQEFADIVAADAPLPPPLAPIVEPAARVVKPSEIHSGTAEIGDRRTNPAGRAPLSAENPRALFGRTVKGRYQIIDLTDQNDASITYLAADQIVADKKVLVRILLDEDAGDELAAKILAEERVSLSHIVHPNLARVIDSGELLEGNPFVISEFVEADSIRDLLRKSKQMNARRAARIVRQTAYALSEIHQNGILHRDLKPEDVLLAVTDAGVEQVKLANFSISGGRIHNENLAYKAPELLEGKNATFAADIYSLGVIAYQMLTGRLPFRAESARELVKAQAKGLTVYPTNLRLDLAEAIDRVIEKALAFNPKDRYPKTRDFGDAFYNALADAAAEPASENRHAAPNVTAPAATTELELPPLAASSFAPRPNGENDVDVLEIEKTSAEKTPSETAEEEAARETSKETAEEASEETAFEDFAETGAAPNALDAAPSLPDSSRKTSAAPNSPPEIAATDEFVSPPQTASTETARARAATAATTEKAESKPAEDLWARRSPEPPVTASRRWILFSALGLLALLGAAWAIWSYSLNRQTEAEIAAPAPQPSIEAQTPVATIVATTNADASGAATAIGESIETPPPARQIAQPPDTVYFQSTKQNLKGDLLRNYLPFSLYYPKDWQASAARESTQEGVRGKFLDASKLTADGQPLEQMLISYYKSEGTFRDDEEKFPLLAKETNETLKKLIPNYQVLSEGKIKVNGDWKAYEVKFQGGGTAQNGEKLIVWGRRLFIPVARAGFPSGYEITMLATSLSPDVRSVDDVGVKGELAAVLATFEPNQNF